MLDLDMLAHLVSQDKHFSAAETVSVTAQAATVGAAVGSVAVVNLSLPEWAAIVSMTVAVLGFLIQLVLAVRVFLRDAQERRDDREAQAFEREAAAKDRQEAREERNSAGDDRAKILRAVERKSDAS